MIKSVHLIVSTERTKTLNRALHKAAIEVCESSGLHTHITDIYELYHNEHPAVFPYGIDISESDHDDIKIEQEKILNSELIIIQFPFYWFSFPGLLKTYFDRVLEKGFAYSGDFAHENPLLNGRNVLFSITTDFMEDHFTKKASFGTLDQFLFPITKSFQLVGMEVKTPFVCFGVHNKPNSEIESCIQTLKSHVKNLVGKTNLVASKN